MKTSTSPSPLEQELVKSIFSWLPTVDIKAIGVIGSYTTSRSVRPGSDIDVVVVVADLGKLAGPSAEALHKMGRVVDPQGERFEFNTKMNGMTVDVTVIDRFNTPNNPLRDLYENHLGWCESAMAIYGPPLSEVFEIDVLKSRYAKIRERRLAQVHDKIASTKQKILYQRRRDLHVLFELQQFVFIREVIESGIFNRQSIKHAPDVIPGFDRIFADELRRDCGVSLIIDQG